MRRLYDQTDEVRNDSINWRIGRRAAECGTGEKSRRKIGKADDFSVHPEINRPTIVHTCFFSFSRHWIDIVPYAYKRCVYRQNAIVNHRNSISFLFRWRIDGIRINKRKWKKKKKKERNFDDVSSGNNSLIYQLTCFIK